MTTVCIHSSLFTTGDDIFELNSGDRDGSRNMLFVISATASVGDFSDIEEAASLLRDDDGVKVRIDLFP